jgi:UMF1 family MFS transporter
MGYLGGGLLLALNLAWILMPQAFGMSDTLSAVRLSFLSVAVWWAAFSIPLFRFVAEPPPSDRRPRVSFARQTLQAFVALRGALSELRRYPHAFLLLLAFLLYNDGIQTIIRMASIYGAEIGIDRNDRILAFVLVQFLGVPFALLFGQLAVRLGARPSLFVALGVYTLIAGIGYFMSTATEFFVLAGLVATVQGGSQALSRSLFASMIPRSKSSEFFGFFSVFEKIAGVLGPALFAMTAVLTGSSRSAVLAVVIFFVAGAAVLAKVDVAEGQAMAARQRSG